MNPVHILAWTYLAVLTVAGSGAALVFAYLAYDHLRWKRGDK